MPFTICMILIFVLPMMFVGFSLISLSDKEARKYWHRFTLHLWALWAPAFFICNHLFKTEEVDHTVLQDVSLNEDGRAVVIDDERVYQLNRPPKNRGYRVDHNLHYPLGTKVKITYYKPQTYCGTYYLPDPKLELIDE